MSSLGENILFADADGSTDFEALNKFEKIIKEGANEILICGSRCHLTSDTEAIVKVRSFMIVIAFVYLCFFLRDQFLDYF